jgi:hypothetical protein
MVPEEEEALYMIQIMDSMVGGLVEIAVVFNTKIID